MLHIEQVWPSRLLLNQVSKLLIDEFLIDKKIIADAGINDTLIQLKILPSMDIK